MSIIQTPLELTTYWLEEIIIGLDLCPFAKIPYKLGLVRLIECSSVSEEEQLAFFLDELEHLQKTPGTKLSTTLISFINDKQNFHDFNDFVGICEDLLVESGLEEHFQVVVFHPDFYFENTEKEERINLVNRSPFPIIHILRNSEIEMAMSKLSSSLSGESLSEKNEVMLSELSQDQIKKLFYYSNIL